MIFVTVGTHYLPFDRLIELIRGLHLTEKIVIQSGQTVVNIPGATVKSYLTFEEMMYYISNARCVITHAGPATIYQVLQLNKNLPIVIPRLKQYKEHVSDHQSHFAEYLHRKKKVVLPQDKKDLLSAINNPILASDTELVDQRQLAIKIKHWIKKIQHNS